MVSNWNEAMAHIRAQSIYRDRAEGRHEAWIADMVRDVAASVVETMQEEPQPEPDFEAEDFQ